jgi:HEPN domain-containing protein
LPKSPTPPPLSRAELKDLSSKMLETVKSLQEKGDYCFVRANVGFVIEFALKAVICKALSCPVYPYPPDKSYRTHDLNDLIQKAGLQKTLQNRLTENKDFYVNWSLTSSWSPEYRYMPVGCTSKAEAEEMINALEHPQNGVYVWIQIIW